MDKKSGPRTAKEYLESIGESLEGIVVAPHDASSRRNLSTAKQYCQELWNLLGFPSCPIGDLILRPRKISLKK